MFEAYAVGVKVSLINQASSGLLALSSQFGQAGRSAAQLQNQLNSIRRLAGLSLASAGVASVGFMGLGAIAKLIKPAEEYTHQLNIMNMAGMKQREIAESVGLAWKLAGQNLTTTATGNLKSLLDLRNVLGDLKEAKMALPIVSKIQTVLGASTEGKVRNNAQDLAFGVAKSLDIIGAARDPATFERQAEAMARVIVATQGRVTPGQFQSVFNYARQAKFGLSEEFLYQILPTLMLENSTGSGGGGGSKGVGPGLAAMYRVVNQGYVNKQSLGLWEKLGYIKPGSALNTTTNGTTLGRAMLGGDLEASNPFLWAQRLATDIKNKFGNVTPQKMQQIVGELFRGNQLAASLVGEFIQKAQNFTRDQQLIQGTMPLGQAYEAAVKSDPETAQMMVQAQFENLKTAFAINVIPILVPAMVKLAKGLNDLSDWARNNPETAKHLIEGFAALSAAMAFGGTVMALGFAFKGLGLSMSALTLSIGASGTAANAAVGALTLFGKGLILLRGLLVAGTVGYAVGTAVYDKKIAGTTLGDQLGEAITHWAAIFGSKDAREAMMRMNGHDPFENMAPLLKRMYGPLNPNADVPFYEYQQGAPSDSERPIQVNVELNVDGHKLADIVSQHQVKQSDRSQRGGRTVYDWGIGPPIPAYNGNRQ